MILTIGLGLIVSTICIIIWAVIGHKLAKGDINKQVMYVILPTFLLIMVLVITTTNYMDDIKSLIDTTK